jgi:hypothetical protein
MITNTDIMRSLEQIFASSKFQFTPFYNRDISKKEILSRFTSIKNEDKSLAYFISAPLGTGKTFFIDTVVGEMYSQQKINPLYLKELNDSELESWGYDIIFIDECDIKTPWKTLQKGMELVSNYVCKSGKIAVLIGDYSLRNEKLVNIFNKTDYLNNFEYIDKEFLKGLINQRIEFFVEKKPGLSEPFI